MSRKLPLRTYQRKNIVNPLIKNYDSTQTDLLSKFDDIPKKQHDIDSIKENEINEDSLDCDPFETTFDRIAKDAVVPPIPFDCNEDKSWYDSSFDNSNEKENQNESLFHVSIGVSTTIIDPDIKYVNTYDKISCNNNTKRRKKKTYNAKASSKSKHMKQLTSLKVESHIETKGKKRKLRKVVKKKENESGNTESLHLKLNRNSDELHEQHTINNASNEMSNNEIINTNVISNRNTYGKRTNFFNSDKSKLHGPLRETTNILNIYDKEKTCSLKSIDKIQKLNNESNQNFSSVSSKSDEISQLRKHFKIKPCSVILNKDNEKEWKLMLKKSKNIVKKGNVLNDSVNITYQLPMIDLNFKENLTCSTPISTCKKRLTNSTLCSPINTDSSMKCITDNSTENVLDSKTLFTLHTHAMNDINPSVNQPQPTNLHVLDQIPIINSTDTELCAEDNILHKEDIMDNSLSNKNDVDVQEQKLSHLGIFEDSVNFINNRERYNTVFMDDSIDLVLRQNHSKTHKKNNPLLNVLNTSVETNRSRSLFYDSESKLHSLTSDDNISSDKSLGNTDAQRSNTDNKLKLELSALNVHNDEEIIKLEELKQKQSCEPMTIMEKESVDKSIKKETENIEDKCYKELYANKIQSDINETNTFFIQIQNSAQVTKRRAKERKQNFNLSDIRENEIDCTECPTSEILQYNEKVNDHNSSQNPSKTLANTTTSNTVTCYDNKNILLNRHMSFSPEKCIFLKPGKFWARSLSILRNLQNGFNQNEMSIEKGRKWRHSVQTILGMQKKDLSSCREADNHIDKLQLCNETQIKSCNEFTKEYNGDQSALFKRFTRRISVRVVRDSKCIQNSDDISFLEVYGIFTNTKSESTTLETNCITKCETQFNDDGNSYTEICSSKIAREVVLQRCSQKNYLPFKECIPDTYLKYCQKIGEGVYGEVFLYNKDTKKSVLKIIPIEGDQLVNGEPQKKFNEILSEIVIAKELHNLRFSKIHSTSGFVEVKSIKCIKGKYPEEMINLWKDYDNKKTSDNDCPSIFDENQLYITFELGHGGQDLEAFEFYTAFEAHALFIQTALALAVAEKSLEFEHRDLHWGNILISNTNEQYIYYKLDNKDIFLPSHGVKVCIIDYTLSRMLYQGCCIFNDLALDPVLFTAQGEYQFEIYRLMRNKIQNNWQEYEPYTNILWLHYILDKMVKLVRYKKKNLKKHKNAITMLQKLKEVILSYESAFDFVNNCDQITNLIQNISA